MVDCHVSHWPYVSLSQECNFYNFNTIFSILDNDACNNKAFMERMNEITKQNRKTEGFIRKGKAGGYKEEMSQEFIKKFESWMKEMSGITSGFNKN